MPYSKCQLVLAFFASTVPCSVADVGASAVAALVVTAGGGGGEAVVKLPVFVVVPCEFVATRRN